jgi:hypothetical protein
MPAIPSAYQLLEIAYIPPSAPSSSTSITEMTACVFHLKQEFALTKQKVDGRPATSGGSARAVRLKYSYHEDLTRDTFMDIKELLAEDCVAACWTVAVGGHLHLKLSIDPDSVPRVKSVYGTKEDILRPK